MTQFILTTPVHASQYTGSNSSEIQALVNAGGRRSSFDNQLGPLHFYNDGPEIYVEKGEWVVRIGKQVVVLEDQSFTEVFAPTAS
jgi:hypothetical protein